MVATSTLDGPSTCTCSKPLKPTDTTPPTDGKSSSNTDKVNGPPTFTVILLYTLCEGDQDSWTEWQPFQEQVLLTCICIANKWVLPFLIIATYALFLMHNIFQISISGYCIQMYRWWTQGTTLVLEFPTFLHSLSLGNTSKKWAVLYDDFSSINLKATWCCNF